MRIGDAVCLAKSLLRSTARSFGSRTPTHLQTHSEAAATSFSLSLRCLCRSLGRWMAAAPSERSPCRLVLSSIGIGMLLRCGGLVCIANSVLPEPRRQQTLSRSTCWPRAHQACQTGVGAGIAINSMTTPLCTFNSLLTSQYLPLRT